MRRRRQQKHKFWLPKLATFSSDCFFILVSSIWLLAPASASLVTANSYRINPQKLFLSEANSVASRPPVDREDIALYPLPIDPSVGLGYGWRVDPATGKTVLHSGVDLLAPIGTSVLAVDNGVVAFAAKRGDYGNIVVINHQGGRQTRYAHLGSIAIKVGQRVQRGSQLGTVGSTGSPDIDQPHLHFELRYNSPKGWVAQDPLPWLGISAQGAVLR